MIKKLARWFLPSLIVLSVIMLVVGIILPAFVAALPELTYPDVRGEYTGNLNIRQINQDGTRAAKNESLAYADLYITSQTGVEPEKFEYYDIGEWLVNSNIYGDYWNGQTFTPSINHRITLVKLGLRRDGSPGTVTVGIRATNGTVPIGDDLCFGTTNGNTLPTNTTEWREITFGDGYMLSDNIAYAIVVRATSGNNTNHLIWLVDSESPSYNEGSLRCSDNGGATWSGACLNADAMFEEWGYGVNNYKVQAIYFTSKGNSA